MIEPNWNDIRVFLAIYRTGTLSAAGAALGVHASTVGRRLDALEAEIDALLFQRSADGLLPTASAEEIFVAAETMERQAQLIGNQLSGRSSALKGHVRIATTADFASHFLVRRLTAFTERHPEITVELLTGTGLVDLTRGEADIAVRFMREDGSPVHKAQEQTLIARRLKPAGISLFASRDYLARKGHPPSAKELAGHDLVMPLQAWVPGYDWSLKYGGECRSAMRTDAPAGLVAAAIAGQGITPLPSFMADGQPELVRIGPPFRIAVRHTWLLMPMDLRRVARVRALWDFLIQMVDDEEATLTGIDPEP